MKLNGFILLGANALHEAMCVRRCLSHAPDIVLDAFFAFCTFRSEKRQQKSQRDSLYPWWLGASFWRLRINATTERKKKLFAPGSAEQQCFLSSQLTAKFSSSVGLSTNMKQTTKYRQSAKKWIGLSQSAKQILKMQDLKLMASCKWNGSRKQPSVSFFDVMTSTRNKSRGPWPTVHGMGLTQNKPQQLRFVAPRDLTKILDSFRPEAESSAKIYRNGEWSRFVIVRELRIGNPILFWFYVRCFQFKELLPRPHGSLSDALTLS